MIKKVPITLLPITEKEEFKDALKVLNIEKDINELYLKTGGIIRIMISNTENPSPQNILNNKPLLNVLIHLYNINEKQIQEDPFKRNYATHKNLKEICMKYDENFKEETLKIWCDEGYLLSKNGSYSYLTANTLLKIYERSPEAYFCKAEEDSPKKKLKTEQKCKCQKTCKCQNCNCSRNDLCKTICKCKDNK